MNPKRSPTSPAVMVIGADARLLGWMSELFGPGLKSVPGWMDAIAEVSTKKYALVLGSIVETGRDSSTAVSALRSADRKIKIILYCQPMLEPLARETLAAGADDYLIEPISRSELIGLLNGQLTQIADDTTQAEPQAEITAPAQPQTSTAPQPSDLYDFCGQLIQSSQLGLEELLQRAQNLLAPKLAAQWVRLGLFEQSPPSEKSADLQAQQSISLAHGGGLLIEVGPPQSGQVQGPGSAQVLEQIAKLLGPLVDMTRETAALQKLAITDELTGLYNRRYIYEFTEQVLARARLERFEVTVLLFDVDDFKQYNDAYGHATGDEVLKDTADLMRRCSREHDLVGRFGGDEFAMIFWDAEKHRQPGSRHPQTAFALSERFRRTVKAHDYKCLGPRAKGTLTISGGLASFPWDASTVDGLFAKADHAMLKAKDQGKNRIFIVGREDQS